MQRILVVALFFSVAAQAVSLSPKAVFLVQGGYDSCNTSSRADLPPLGIKMVPSFQKMLGALAKRDSTFTPIVLSGCLDTEPPPDGEVQLVLPENPRSLVYGNTLKVQNELARLARAYPDAPLIVIGHSYGAWMAMHVALKPAVKRLALLVTLDPIGPECGPLGVVFGDSACHNAPAVDSRAIRQKSDKWLNFYQDDDSWLSSSEIPGAENYAVDATWGPHSEINRNARVWAVIQKAVFEKIFP